MLLLSLLRFNSTRNRVFELFFDLFVNRRLLFLNDLIWFLDFTSLKLIDHLDFLDGVRVALRADARTWLQDLARPLQFRLRLRLVLHL